MNGFYKLMESKTWHLLAFFKRPETFEQRLEIDQSPLVMFWYNKQTEE